MKLVFILEILPTVFLITLGFIILLSANSIIPSITQIEYTESFFMFSIIFVSLAGYLVITELKSTNKEIK
jgi:general stress protein CsbA